MQVASVQRSVDVLAAVSEPRPEDAAVTQFISFAIGTDQYGVDIMAVREIKGWTDITHLPKQPDYVRGVLNLRGGWNFRCGRNIWPMRPD